MGQGGKLGFTDRCKEVGKEVGKNFEGCISLLTSMNVIAQTKTANRTPEEATGSRVRQAPLTPARILVALANMRTEKST